MPKDQSVWTEAQCEPGQWSDGPGEPVTKHGCKTPNLCGPSSDGWTTIPTPSPTGEFPMYSPGQCGMRHSAQHGDPSASWIGDDPQFLGEASFAGYKTEVNHEIDIEIPANCQGTPNVCDVRLNTSWGKQGVCTGLYNTANFNNYIYTNNMGVGPAYSNMCIRAWKGEGGAAARGGTPLDLVGDGKYHNYSFDWHSGDASAGVAGRVDFYFDGVYMGTNNAHVPTRASRLWLAHWYNGGQKNPTWNGFPNDWVNMSTVPAERVQCAAGDGNECTSVTFIKSVTITPHNEANDIAYPAVDENPDANSLPSGMCTPSCNHQTVAANCHPHLAWYPIGVAPAPTPGPTPGPGRRVVDGGGVGIPRNAER